MVENNGIISSLSDFQVGEDWDLYAERLDQFFVGNNIPKARWVAVLITKLGSEAYKILRDLCDPVVPKTKPFDELCKILKEQFAPKISAFKERVEFYSLMQKDDESMSDWFARIKNKAIHCKFGATLDDKIKDKFITGLLRGPILDKMCEQDTTMSLKDIVENARNKEATLSRATSRTPADQIHRLQINYRRDIKQRVQIQNYNNKPRGKNSTGQKSDNSEPTYSMMTSEAKYATYLGNVMTFGTVAVEDIHHFKVPIDKQKKYRLLSTGQEFALCFVGGSKEEVNEKAKTIRQRTCAKPTLLSALDISEDDEASSKPKKTPNIVSSIELKVALRIQQEALKEAIKKEESKEFRIEL
ncbi:uncharacterized protein LOC107045918 isoform X2 [Diachasma alloeum]|uniref:uncharacterized protein LOC107045918 isoform X2 n=1 Tax=Diachasma alloeum TaxID=454923 RepID=UPI0007382F21|nr:uncharacterized protein LOC107045918 isoform X2 [Diachasma alloeum]